MTGEELKIEITHSSDEYYHITLNGKRLRMCSGYNELALCIGSIIKGAYKENKDECSYR